MKNERKKGQVVVSVAVLVEESEGIYDYKKLF